DDHTRQEKAWAEGKRAEWLRRPERLRDALTEGEISTDSELGKFVGVEVYEKANGIVRRDMFGLAGEAWLTDPKLVKQLALEKLEKEAEKLRRQGWAWVEARLEFDYSDRYDFGRSQDKSVAGAVVTIGNYNGKLETVTGLVRPEDIKQGKRTGTAAAQRKPARKPGDLSFASVQRLQAEANGLIRAHVAQQPQIALALLVADLAGSVFHNHGGDPRLVHISQRSSGRVTGAAREYLEAGEGGQRLAGIGEHLAAKLAADGKGLRAWALQEDSETLGQLLAYLVAREI